LLVKFIKRIKIFEKTPKVIESRSLRYFYSVESYRECHYYTVKEITQNIKSLLERNFYQVWIEGEISNVKQSQTGNIYFNLVEEEATLKALVFKNSLTEEIRGCLRNGVKVLAFGTLSFYSKSEAK